MKLDVSEITAANGAILDFAYNEEPEAIALPTDEVWLDKPVAFSGRLTNHNGTLKLDGKMDVGYSSKCYRCLRDVSGVLKLDISEDIIKDGTASEDDVYTYSGNTVDMDRIVRDNIILNIPMKQLCREDCQGICQICGKDLNNGKCGCEARNEINPQMEKLKNFFK